MNIRRLRTFFKGQIITRISHHSHIPKRFRRITKRITGFIITRIHFIRHLWLRRTVQRLNSRHIIRGRRQRIKRLASVEHRHRQVTTGIRSIRVFRTNRFHRNIQHGNSVTVTRLRHLRTTRNRCTIQSHNSSVITSNRHFRFKRATRRSIARNHGSFLTTRVRVQRITRINNRHQRIASSSRLSVRLM